MKSVRISLQMASQVKKFVSIVQNYSFEIDLRSDRYVVDAKSILGIFSLDLSKPIDVEIHAEEKNIIVQKFLIVQKIGSAVLQLFFQACPDFLFLLRQFLHPLSKNA